MRYLTVLFLSLASVLAAADRPNIVVFLSDDHTVRDSSVYGSKDFPTPNMQRLASAGTTFDNAYVVSPSCAPSRAALLTGLFPQRNGAEANHAAPRADIKKLPAYFQELGYQVVSFGKVGHYNQTRDYGFDNVRHTGYHEDVAIPEAVKWLDQRKSKKPLCLIVGTNWPHVPWPQNADGIDPAKLDIPLHHVDTPVSREWRARYATAVRNMDRDLGLVMDAVQRVLGPDTFILHSSDHGAQWPFGKWTLYDDGLRTPLIVSWPGKIAAGKRTDAMVTWVDFLPTLVAVAGGDVPKGLDGKSFLPELLGQPFESPRHVFATHSGDGNHNVYPSRSMRTRDGWKYIRNLHPEFLFASHTTGVERENSYWQSWLKAAETDPAAASTVHRYQNRPAEELYDTRADPFEMKNLAGDPAQAERLTAMHTAVDSWMKDTGDPQKTFGKPTLRTPQPPVAEDKPKD
ncbi:MAG: sulfatase [Verrucomicrobiota bacterium]